MFKLEKPSPPKATFQCHRCFLNKTIFYVTEENEAKEKIKEEGWKEFDGNFFCNECSLMKENEIPEIIEFNYSLHSNRGRNFDVLNELEGKYFVVLPDRLKETFPFFMYEVNFGIRWNTKTNEKWIISIGPEILENPILVN